MNKFRGHVPRRSRFPRRGSLVLCTWRSCASRQTASRWEPWWLSAVLMLLVLMLKLPLSLVLKLEPVLWNQATTHCISLLLPARFYTGVADTHTTHAAWPSFPGPAQDLHEREYRVRNRAVLDAHWETRQHHAHKAAQRSMWGNASGILK